MDSQIYPPARRRIPRHAHPKHRRIGPSTLPTVVLGAIVLGMLSLGPVAGVAPAASSSPPSFAPLSLDGAARSNVAEPVAGATSGDGSADGTAPLRAAPATCEAVPPAPAAPAPGHPGAGVSRPPIAAPLSPRRAVFLGDSYTSGYLSAGIGPDGWPAIVSAALRWRSTNFAVPGTGFVNPGWTGQPIGSLVDDTIRLQPNVVVVVGGHNDRRFGATGASAAADEVIDLLRAGLPDAILVVIGPIWQDGSPANNIVELRDHLRSKAGTVGAIFIDPLAGRWFAGSNNVYIGSDGVHPTNAGHRHIAELVLAALRADPRFSPPLAEAPERAPAPVGADGDPSARARLAPACPG